MTPQEYTQEYARDYFQTCTSSANPSPHTHLAASSADLSSYKHYLEDCVPQKKSKKDYPELYEECVKSLEQKEKEMSYDRNANTETSKRNTMESSLYYLGDTVKTKLSEKFGLRDLPAPKTVQEYENRLKAGEYVIEKDRYSDYPRLRWRLPTTVEDNDGFNAAWRKFCDARDKVLLKIAVADLPEALKAVEDFRDTDISVYYS